MEPISRRRALQLGGLGVAAIAAGGVGLARTGDLTVHPAHGDCRGRAPGAAQHQRRAAGPARGRLRAGPGGRAGGHHPELQRRAARADAVTCSPATACGSSWSTGWPSRPTCTCTACTSHRRATATTRSSWSSPGQAFGYDYLLPDDHPTGVFWYHPHHHGLVADQIFGGLYGAIIVGDPNPIPVTRGTRPRRLRHLPGRGRSQCAARPMAQMMGREGELVLVNGQTGPS